MIKGQHRKQTAYGLAFCMGCLLSAPSAGSAKPAFPNNWLMYQSRPDHNAVFRGGSRAVSWERSFLGKINGGIAVVDGVIYVSSFDRHVYALDAKSGAVIWSRALANISMSTPSSMAPRPMLGRGLTPSSRITRPGLSGASQMEIQSSRSTSKRGRCGGCIQRSARICQHRFWT